MVGVLYLIDMRNLIQKIILEYTEEVKESKRYTNYDMNDESFARVFQFFMAELKLNTGFSRAKMLHSFGRTIRNWTDKPPKIISKRVLDHFIVNYPDLNPFKANYRPRNRYGINVIVEHTTPVNEFIFKLSKTENLEEIKRVMGEYTGISIITFEEDQCLSERGFSRSRPQGWEHAYNQCNIEVMDEQEYNRYRNELFNPVTD